MSDIEQPDLTQLTVQLLSSYFSNNTVPASDIASIIQTTRTALRGETTPPVPAEPEHVPAVSARKSLGSRDHIISMIDGKPYKMLKRHLATNGLTPAEYRERYKLPATYPMVAPNYAEQRRAVAAKIGLGQRRPASKAADVPAQTEAAPARVAAEVAPVVKKAPAKAAAAKKAAPRAKSVASKPTEAAAPAKVAPVPAVAAAPAETKVPSRRASTKKAVAPAAGVPKVAATKAPKPRVATEAEKPATAEAPAPKTGPRAKRAKTEVSAPTEAE